jgi:stage II sporulation protein D
MSPAAAWHGGHVIRDRTPRCLAVLLLAVLLLIPSGCSGKRPPQPAADTPLLHVRVYSAQTQVSLVAQAPPAVSVDGQPARRLNLSPGQAIDIRPIDGGWQIGAATVSGRVLRIVPVEDGTLSLNGARHRGEYRLVPTRNGRFDVINDVDVESYLKGVIARELLSDWHLEAYRAQAVAARTYALYEMRTSDPDDHFHVHADTRSQVYGGIDGETRRSIDAVETTRGLVLAYGPQGRERIFKAYFSSCCGGVTASVQDVFNEPVIEPLQAQFVGPLCNASPRYNWPSVVLGKQELTRRIRLYGERRGSPEKNMASLDRIDIAMTNPYGRPSRFQLTDVRGNRFSLTSEELRWAINTDAQRGTTVFSGFFKPVVESDTIRFVEGHGFGHGVGLCQWCTQVRATQGLRYDRILQAAYPASVLLRAY